ncbi:MAG: O-antigen ligase family protein, partial [Clostridia bacterium]|nr:O-antigen ligase family protein [Clostridia bacterium]
VILYGGYVFLMGVVLTKLLFYDKSKLYIFKDCRRLFWFVAYSVLSLFWAYNKDYVFTQIPLLLACMAMTVIMSDYFVKQNNVELILWTIAIAGVSLALYVILSYGGITRFYESALQEQYSLEAQRMGADITNVNVIGMQCGFATVILFYFALIKKYKICYFVMLLPFLTSAASGSRKALILLIAGIVMVAYHHITNDEGRRKYLKVFVGFVILLVGVMTVLSMDIMQTAIGRFQQSMSLFSGNTEAADGTSQLRLEMILTGLKRFWNEPILGYGLANSRVVNRVTIGYEAYSHNDYIELILNGGLIGFILYYGMIIRILKNYIAIMRTDNDSELRISFYILILFLFTNFAAVTYYGSIITYVYFTLWISQSEIKRRN